MLLPDSGEPILDQRPMYRVPYLRFLAWCDKVRAIGKAGDPLWTDDLSKRVDFVEAVVMFGNAGGRYHPTIDLPRPWSIPDVEHILGGEADGQPEPGSIGAWRKIRAHYDATQSGRSGGRTA